MNSSTEISDLLSEMLQDICYLEQLLEDDHYAPHFTDKEQIMMEGIVNGMNFALHRIHGKDKSDD